MISLSEIHLAPPDVRVSISDPMTAVDAAVTEAALRLIPDEDDLAAADEYPIASPETRAAAIDLATRIVRAAAKLDTSKILVPRFSASGGVDLRWRGGPAGLLVAVPADPTGVVEFYGESREDGRTYWFKGSMRGDGDVDMLARWLAKHERPGR